MRHLLVALLSLCCVTSVFADELDTRQSILYPYSSTIRLQEDFISASSAVGVIGALNWAFSGGTVVTISGEANHPGLLRRSTNAGITNAATFINASTGNVFTATLPHYVHSQIRLNDVDNNTYIRVGFANSWASSLPNQGFWIEKALLDTNWFCVNRNSTTGTTRVDSGVAVTTSFFDMRHVWDGTGTRFYINGVDVCGYVTGDIPSASLFLGPGFTVGTDIAATKTADLDYIDFNMTGFTR